MTGVEQSLVQQIFSTVEEAYLADIRNQKTNSINNTLKDVLTHHQYNYCQLMPHEILEHKDFFKNMTYHPQGPTATILSAVEELLEFLDISGTLYTQLQAVNIASVIIHSTGKFGLAIREWNCITTVQKTWVIFKTFFHMAHQELQETSNLTIEDNGMHHVNMVRNGVAGL